MPTQTQSLTPTSTTSPSITETTITPNSPTQTNNPNPTSSFIPVGTTTNNGTTHMYFGADQALSRFFTGYVGEILLYTQTLNGSSLANTEKYLKDKWSIL